MVEHIVDGDTVDVRAHIWLGQSLTVRVRIDGVDAPETRSDCADERRLALAARDYLARRLLNREIRLIRVVYDKFGGRVRAEISDADGDIARALIAARTGAALSRRAAPALVRYGLTRAGRAGRRVATSRRGALRRHRWRSRSGP